MFAFCGSKSGRDVNKIEACNLTPFVTPNGSIAYEQARLVFECKKLYAAPLIADGFIDKNLLSNYTAGDYHVQYIAEITNCLIK